MRTLEQGDPRDWLLVEDGAVRAAGYRDDEPVADREIDLSGATALPAFCDAHVHLPATGLFADSLDFGGERSARAILERFGHRARTSSGILLGVNFEDPLDQPITRWDLDAVVAARPALLVRADMHSCIVSSALLDQLDLADDSGLDRASDGSPTGYLRETAAAEAWRWFDQNLPDQVQRDAIVAAVRLAYSKGVAEVHEMHVVEWRGWRSFDLLQDSARDVALRMVPYVATAEVSRIKEIGLDRIGGDYFLDGSFGSHTAWLTAPYRSAPPSGSSSTGLRYRSDGDLLDFFVEAQAAGLQTGVHAIGDAAIEQAIATWEEVARRVGRSAVRARGHRIEHFECATDVQIRRAADLGLKASVQPAFDHLWGGAEGLYAQRIGWERARLMNRFNTMTAAGLRLGAGSDSTVTPLDPFFQMAALREHHVPEESLDAATALYLHTTGARSLAGELVVPPLRPGAPADIAVVDRDPVVTAASELAKTEVVATWIGGQRVWPDEEAETW